MPPRAVAVAAAVVGLAFTLGGGCSDPAPASGAPDAEGGAPIGDDEGGAEGGGGRGGGDASSGGSDGGSDGPLFVDAGATPAVQLLGRFDTRDVAGPKCGWPGCRIRARFDGTSVSVRLREIVAAWMDGAPSEWDVAVDGAWQAKIVTTAGARTYAIATSLAAGVHEVELFKRSEAQNGVTQFLGFDFGGGKLLSPPLRSTRRIEIVGDSQPAAFGVEGVGYANNDCPGLDYAAAWQNFRKSFGAVLGVALGAEVHGTVYSGKGLVKNIWRPDTETMPRIFGRSNPVDDTSTWSFASWQADVVIVMIGGNDFAIGQPDENGANGPTTPTELTNAYRAFASTIRTSYPAAHVFLSASPSLSDMEPAGRGSRTNVLAAIDAVVADRRAAGDAKVHAFSPTLAAPSELTACNGHGTPAFHARVAGEYAAIVKQKTGW